MKKTILSLMLSLTMIVNGEDLTQYVNPFIGTSNFGTCYPGPVVPHGIVSVVPINITKHAKNKYLNVDSNWVSATYVKPNGFMTGFSHVNFSGAGCPDLGSLLLMPTTGDIELDYNKYGSTYNDELAKVGYYSMFLDKYNVKCEMSSTERTGISRYTFPKGKSNIILNLGHGLSNESGAYLKFVNDREIEGFRMLGTFCYTGQAVFPIYFVVKFNKTPKEMNYWKKMKRFPGKADEWGKESGKIKIYTKYQKQLAGDDCGAYATFETAENESVEVQVGVSYVSIENARLNLEAEQPNFNFESVRNQSIEKWNKVFSSIKVEGGSFDDKTKFYTAMYHTMIAPVYLQDVTGEYPMMESSKIGKISKGNRYSTFSLWDTYRCVHQFYSLVFPKMQLDMVRSMVDMYKESGWLPKWEAFGREFYVMEGDPATAVIADTYLRGLKDFDVNAAYQAMFKSATTEGSKNLLRPDIDDYLKLGYCPLTGRYDNSVSHALEYYIADYSLSQFAKALGKIDDYNRFYTQSLQYKNYWDKDFNMIRPKNADGTFFKDFNPREGENFMPSAGFHEGNAWQYTFMIPHDIKNLMKSMGGEKVFVKTLNKIFDEGLFDMCNEPDISYPYLYNYVKGEEWRTQITVKNLISKHFKNNHDGLPGNDDLGTLSTWLMFGMMGIYPTCAGNPDFTFTTPSFDKIILKLDAKHYGNEQLTISLKKTGKENSIIKKILVDGKVYKSYFISHSDLVKAKNIEFIVGDK